MNTRCIEGIDGRLVAQLDAYGVCAWIKTYGPTNSLLVVTTNAELAAGKEGT